jgi:hypothetical protein
MDWISVKHGLPEKCGAYLVCYEVNGVLKTHYSIWQENSRKYQGNKFGWKSREKVRRCNIKYWMPLPKPPENGA